MAFQTSISLPLLIFLFSSLLSSTTTASDWDSDWDAPGGYSSTTSASDWDPAEGKSLTTTASNSATFIKCISQYNNDTTNPITNVLYSSHNSSYSSLYETPIQNLLYINSSTFRRPNFIITPLTESHIQAAVICSRKHNLLIRVRSGGHDYEGLSNRSPKPFIIVDLMKFENITVDVQDSSAWVQAGATVGQVYYRINEKTSTLGFPAGVCATMGVGGQISGGGMGYYWRKYGLSSDNVLDARFIDIKGKLLDRKSMGEDLFWAINGGGGASFGVIVAYKIKLVPVTPIVTSIERNLTQVATSLFYKWQTVAPTLPRDLNLRVIVFATGPAGSNTIGTLFQGRFFGTIEQLLPIMKTHFPELGVEARDCTETTWFGASLSLGRTTFPAEVLLQRSPPFPKNYFKGKSDFVTKPITKSGLERIWKYMLADPMAPQLVVIPMGGRMAEIAATASPYPHRAGNLYNVQYTQQWNYANETEARIESLRKLYDFMAPFVSSNPRTAYLNYRDFDLGVNKDVKTTYIEASIWGNKYFKDNFKRLACVKKKVDPTNFFWNEQTVPPYCSK